MIDATPSYFVEGESTSRQYELREGADLATLTGATGVSLDVLDGDGVSVTVTGTTTLNVTTRLVTYTPGTEIDASLTQPLSATFWVTFTGGSTRAFPEPTGMPWYVRRS